MARDSCRAFIFVADRLSAIGDRVTVPFYLSPAEINLGKRESVYDVAKNLERMVQGIMIRTFAPDIVERMGEYASIPIITGLTDYSHPCQAMADYFTMLEIKGEIKGLKVAYIGDGNASLARPLHHF